MVTLRKVDSTTSLLLFVYNNYFSEYNKDILKLSSLLEIMKSFGKSESATRMSLSRTVKAGILVNQNLKNEVYYSLAANGKHAIRIWNSQIRRFWQRYALRHQPWDQKWHLLNLNFTEDNKDSRSDVVERLKQIGFVLLSANTWISPYNQPKEIEELLTEFNISQSAVEMHGEMTIYRDTESFVESVFHMKDLEEPYKQFVETFQVRFEETKKICQEEPFIREGKALPLMHALGWEFFFIAAEDAALPIALHPHWAGDEAARLMREYRFILLDATKKYLEKFE